MMIPQRLLFLVYFIGILLIHHYPSMAQGGAGKRVRFNVIALEEKGPIKKIRSHAEIEGPAGIDFEILLQDDRFFMKACFITDLLENSSILMRATLTTKRLYGYSERNLPLWEEDLQQHRIEVSLDEQLVLLPFGKGGEERLKIEIIPSLAAMDASPQPIRIHIKHANAPGEVRYFARKIPHYFNLKMELLENDRMIASGQGRIMLKGSSKVLLTPVTEGEMDALQLEVTVEAYRGVGSRGSIEYFFNACYKNKKEKRIGAIQLGKTTTLPFPLLNIPAKNKSYKLRICFDA